MCGLAGFCGFERLPAAPETIVRTMGDAIAHRGPDDWGTWVDADAEVALVHRRLSIIDLSPAGHQPMHSASGRLVMVFNGEIYNHAEIRAALEREGAAPAWRGYSDTEVLLEAAATWGIERALKLAVGMFAIALFDRETRELYLARDRLGEKPLYYGMLGRTFVFASELSALTQHPSWNGAIDRDALALFMRHSNVPAPYSIYSGIKKLLPGRFLTFNTKARAERVQTYWDAHDVARRGIAEPFRGTPENAVRTVEELLTSAVKDQMMSDVPLGAFLSGGLDSSAVVATMQSLSRRPIRTFTIGFHVQGYDEAEHARAVAHHLGCDHTELYVTDRDALDVIPRLPHIYSEPFADCSQIPTYLVSALARQHVTVALSGDGGDEVFSGYTRYKFARGLWPSIKRAPHALRRAAAAAALSVSPAAWDRIVGLAPSALRLPRAGEQISKGSRILGARDDDALFEMLVSRWRDPNRVVIGAHAPQLSRLDPALPLVQAMMHHDMTDYLPNDVLVKLDRASMANGLETRAPFLNPDLIAFARSVPEDILFREGKPKWLLRRVLARYVPQTLIDRPKMGFAVPIHAWLRGGLRDWAEGLISETRLKTDGFFESAEVRRAWDSHLNGHADRQHELWNVLMFQAWLQSRSSSVLDGGRADVF